MSDAELHALANEAGLLVDWEDAGGAPRRVLPESLRAVLSAMELPCATEGEARDSRRWLAEQQTAAQSAFLTADVGRSLLVPGVTAGPGDLEMEDGGVLDVALTPAAGGAELEVPPTPGFHRLRIGDREIVIAAAPSRGFTVGEAAAGRRLWGAAVQVYALREGDSGFGDFDDLAAFASMAGAQGADALAISPIHALFAADAGRYSPYAPSSRLFLNGLYAGTTERASGSGPPPEGEDLIDWTQAAPAKLRALRRLFDALETSGSRRESFERFRRKAGADLERHATFEALHARFFADTGARGWKDWPEGFQDPVSPAVAEFARRNAAEVDFHAFVQWRADTSLANAQAAAKDAGMAIGLVTDLAVGIDAGGSQAWSRRQDLLNGLEIGAPPDIFQPAGQGWGIAAFSPLALQRTGFDAFIETLRAATRHAGGVRIDHAMGLRRLWMTPVGASPQDGAYLRYPFEDLLRLIALESHRARAVVVGEDLGTVPEGFRERMDEAGMMGMRVLWFERDPDTEAFTPPERWSSSAAAMTTTHDLPTVAGWWCERDIDWMQRLDRRGRFETPEQERRGRAKDRAQLWTACVDAGVVSGPPPPADEPAQAVDAALALVGRTACEFAIVPVEDLLGLEEQPNLPGTIDEHPNWRRRLPGTFGELARRPAVAARLHRLNRDRSS